MSTRAVLAILFLLFATVCIILYAFCLDGWGFFMGLSAASAGYFYYVCEKQGIFDQEETDERNRRAH